MREDEQEGVDYYFRTKEWMLEHKDEFKIGFKEIKGEYYAYSDETLETKEVLVILAEDALKHFRNGVPCIFVHYWGEVYKTRAGRDSGKEMAYVQNYLDMIKVEAPKDRIFHIHNKDLAAAIKSLEEIYDSFRITDK
jgi:guanylate kinase